MNSPAVRRWFDGEPDRRSMLFVGGMLLLLVLVVHAPLRNGDYVQDDHLAVEGNAIVERGELREILGSSYWEGAQGNDRSLYRPVTIGSYAMEHAVVGQLLPQVSRAINLLLHCWVSLLLYALARRLSLHRYAALAGAAVFAVHPLHVEALANVVGRAELLATGFSLAALIAYTYSGAWDSPGSASHSVGTRRLASWLCGALVLFALGSKEGALATPVLLVALEWLFRPAPGGRNRAWWIGRATALGPAVLAGIVYLALRIEALELLFGFQTPHVMDNRIAHLDGLERLATALALLPRYVGLLLYPIILSADYSGPVIPIESTLFAVRPLLGTAMLLLLLAAIVNVGRADARTISLRRRRIAFAACLFLLPYLVIGNLLLTIGTIFGERLAYYPSVGFCFLWSELLAAMALGGSTSAPRLLEQRRKIVPIIFACLLLAFGLRSWARCFDWQNDETLFRAAAVAKPESPRAHFIVGKLLASQQEFPKAIEQFEHTIRLFPDHVAAHHESGLAYGALRRFGEAERRIGETLLLSPSYALAHVNHAIALRQLGRQDAALKAVRKALVYDSSSARAWSELGDLLVAQGRLRRAIEAYRRALALGRRQVEPRLRQAERRLQSLQQ